MRTSSSGRPSTAEDSSRPVTHWHVLSERGVEVRSSPEASSPVLARLDRGTPLTSDRRQDKAIHVVVPIEGWLDETCPSDNHVLCATGDATMSARWRYRVVCSDGAYVRGGLELSSPHIYTLAPQEIIRAITEMHPELLRLICARVATREYPVASGHTAHPKKLTVGAARV